MHTTVTNTERVLNEDFHYSVNIYDSFKLAVQVNYTLHSDSFESPVLIHLNQKSDRNTHTRSYCVKKKKPCILRIHLEYLCIGI